MAVQENQTLQDELSLITEARRNLCRKAKPKTIEAMERLKEGYYKVNKSLSDRLVPECIYRCGCPDFKNCGYFAKLIKLDPNCASINISCRYAAYNKIFWTKRKKTDENLCEITVNCDTYAYLKFDHIMLVIDKEPIEFRCFKVLSIQNDLEFQMDDCHSTVYTKNYSLGLRALKVPVCDELLDNSIETVYRVVSVSRE